MTAQPLGGDLLDQAAAAGHLNVTERHIRRLRAENGLPFIKLGSKVRFLRSDLDEFIAEARVVRGRGAA